MALQPIAAQTVYFLHRELRRRLTNKMPVTKQSMGYRKRASELAQMADKEASYSDRTKLVMEALNWISLAENEEIIAEAERGVEK
jgi:predicted metal-dependent hydrolase